MRQILFKFILVSAVLLVSCESEEILTAESTHVEHTVVQAEIKPGKVFPAVRFTKTLPLGVPYNIKQSELKNVTAYLIKNEIQVIPLHYVEKGLYKPRYEFYVEEGEIYELIAERDGKYIYGKTIVPFKPNVISTNYNTGSFNFDADIISKINEVYGALWIIPGNPSARADDYYTITSPVTLSNTNIVVRTSSIPEVYRSPSYSDNRYIQVYAFDVSFRKYFYSRTSGQQVTDPFIQGGGAVEWNVQGDKVIGMFIGIAPGDIIKVN